ncbi:hypothetical protein H6F75_02220 [Nodosilinea sp. FACHB-131]|uniref:hypothetical protein n=1 Tax=Cyanophyceae TaxID=3028117 RepID=UPI0016885DAE|nr:hypothetical protein [Nodosilinea sp. FACHB-131]MBD1872285.1 hypothetical protein [Nodosilinea sp. FACHB-131]
MRSSSGSETTTHGGKRSCSNLLLVSDIFYELGTESYTMSAKSAKKKNSKKSTQFSQPKSNQPESKKPQNDTTVLGISPRELGSVVAAAVIAEVSQVAANRISQAVAQSDPKKALQDQLSPINHSVRTVVGGVKDAIADAVSPASEVSDTVESTLVDGRSTVSDGVDRGVENAKEKTAVTAGIAQERASELIDDTKQKADQTREFVVAQIENAIAGAQGRAGKTRRALGNRIDATQDTASATQKAVAQVIDEAVHRVKEIIATNSDSLQGNEKREKKGKKAKKKKG